MGESLPLTLLLINPELTTHLRCQFAIQHAALPFTPPQMGECSL
jgi:hypothetical protein